MASKQGITLSARVGDGQEAVAEEDGAAPASEAPLVVGLLPFPVTGFSGWL